MKYLKGPITYDLNRDGKVDAGDLLKLQKYIVKQNLENTEGTGVISVVGVKGGSCNE